MKQVQVGEGQDEQHVIHYKAVQVCDGSGPLPETFNLYCEGHARVRYYGSGSLKYLSMDYPTEETRELVVELGLKFPQRVNLWVRHSGGVYCIKERMVVGMSWFNAGRSLQFLVKDEP